MIDVVSVLQKKRGNKPVTSLMHLIKLQFVEQFKTLRKIPGFKNHILTKTILPKTFILFPTFQLHFTLKFSFIKKIIMTSTHIGR